MANPQIDDLEAVRLIVDTVKAFPAEEQQRIFRWAGEKLGIAPLPAPASSSQAGNSAIPASNVVPPVIGNTVDVKTFMAEKRPRNDVQFAAAAAYYYRFEAPHSERKDSITKEDLQETARKASRERFANPSNTLNNAHKLGLLDKGAEKATFVINSVGENLVAMTLPDGAPIPKSVKKKKAGKSVTKKAATSRAKKA